MAILIALGANQPGAAGSPDDTLRAALAALPGEGLRLSRVSGLYRTPSVPPGGPDYANAAAVVAADATPEEVLAALHRVEAAFDRDRQQRWGPRTLDLDLLAAGAEIRPNPATLRRWIALPPDRWTRETPDVLLLPHPRLQDRAFVLEPLAEVAPDWRHPVLGRTVTEMRDARPGAERAAVVRVADLQ